MLDKGFKIASTPNSQNDSVMRDVLNNHINNTTFNESIFKNFIHNKENIINSSQHSDNIHRSKTISESHIEPLNFSDSFISVSILDFDKNIYTDTHYSFEVLQVCNSAFSFDNDFKDNLDLEITKNISTTSNDEIDYINQVLIICQDR